MKSATLIRVEKEPLIGMMLLDGKLLCVTLESSYLSIPEGTYECIRTFSPKFGETFEVKVPGRTGILFHVGNNEADTTGCILVGRYPGFLHYSDKTVRSILNSRDCFNHDFLPSFDSDNEFTLHVIKVEV